MSDEDIEAEHHETNDDNLPANTADLFDDSDCDDLSTSDNIVMEKSDIKTGSDNKRKAENDDDNTEDGKKQRSHDKEYNDGVR